ncbi:hypothetical protein WJX74_001625 [Apatococcus lobatus]|uniref:Uncharacterized protein n=1 Tax=Apatococcus lobatus TaxID=904363 RepID=A0AAW1S9E6_9CHLO
MMWRWCPWLAEDSSVVTLAQRGGYREPSAADLVEDVVDDPQPAAASVNVPASQHASTNAAADLPAAAVPPSVHTEAAVEASTDQEAPTAQAAVLQDADVTAASAPVEPAAAALQTEALEELVDYGAEPTVDEVAPAAVTADAADAAALERTGAAAERRQVDDKSRPDRKRERSEIGALEKDKSKLAKRSDEPLRDGSGSRRRDPMKYQAGDKTKPSDQSERRKPTDTKFSDAPGEASKEAKRPSVFDRLQSKSSGGTRSLAARQASSKVTRALRIDGFVRPFPERAARDLISETGGELESFWMPTIKSTAWVVFTSEAVAEATFQAVWGKEWPPGNRSRLNPQYVSPEEAFSKAGLGDGPGVRRQASGTAVAPATNGNAPSVPVIEQAAALTVADGDAKKREGHRSSGAGRHAAEAAGDAAATAARAPIKQEPRDHQRRAADRDQGRRGSRTKPPPAGPPEEAAPTLDTLFKKTTTQPNLYWLPLTEAQAAAKQAAEVASQAGNGPAILAK